jgi:hypothetical protein
VGHARNTDAHVRKRLLLRLPVTVGYALPGSVFLAPMRRPDAAPDWQDMEGATPCEARTQLRILLRKRGHAIRSLCVTKCGAAFARAAESLGAGARCGAYRGASDGGARRGYHPRRLRVPASPQSCEVGTEQGTFHHERPHTRQGTGSGVRPQTAGASLAVGTNGAEPASATFQTC